MEGGLVPGLRFAPRQRPEFGQNALNGDVCGVSIPIENLYTRYVIGVAGNSTSNGASVVQWAYQNLCNNQFWNPTWTGAPLPG